MKRLRDLRGMGYGCEMRMLLMTILLAGCVVGEDSGEFCESWTGEPPDCWTEPCPEKLDRDCDHETFCRLWEDSGEYECRLWVYCFCTAWDTEER